jgi:hypothetical protein
VRCGDEVRRGEADARAIASTGKVPRIWSGCGASISAPVGLALGIAPDADLDEAGDLLEAQHVAGLGAQAGEDIAGADIGVAGERHLGGAVEDADAGSVGRIGGGRTKVVSL